MIIRSHAAGFALRKEDSNLTDKDKRSTGFEHNSGVKLLWWKIEVWQEINQKRPREMSPGIAAAAVEGLLPPKPAAKDAGRTPSLRSPGPPPI